jgi:hypothetical protein
VCARFCAQIAQECTTQFLQHAPMGANTAFIAAFGKHGEDTSPAMRSSLQGAFHTLCVNIKETETSGGEAAAAPTSQS